MITKGIAYYNGNFSLQMCKPLMEILQTDTQVTIRDTSFFFFFLFFFGSTVWRQEVKQMCLDVFPPWNAASEDSILELSDTAHSLKTQIMKNCDTYLSYG